MIDSKLGELMPASDFCDWLAKAIPGDICTYYAGRGLAYMCLRPPGETDEAKAAQALADEANTTRRVVVDAWERRTVELVQRRIRGTLHYEAHRTTAEATRRIEQAVMALEPLRLQARGAYQPNHADSVDVWKRAVA